LLISFTQLLGYWNVLCEGVIDDDLGWLSDYLKDFFFCYDCLNGDGHLSESEKETKIDHGED
jgi:hypothetical protein